MQESVEHVAKVSTRMEEKEKDDQRKDFDETLKSILHDHRVSKEQNQIFKK